MFLGYLSKKKRKEKNESENTMLSIILCLYFSCHPRSFGPTIATGATSDTVYALSYYSSLGSS